jgi:hypothetical protein
VQLKATVDHDLVKNDEQKEQIQPKVDSTITASLELQPAIGHFSSKRLICRLPADRNQIMALRPEQAIEKLNTQSTTTTTPTISSITTTPTTSPTPDTPSTITINDGFAPTRYPGRFVCGRSLNSTPFRNNGLINWITYVQIQPVQPQTTTDCEENPPQQHIEPAQQIETQEQQNQMTEEPPVEISIILPTLIDSIKVVTKPNDAFEEAQPTILELDDFIIIDDPIDDSIEVQQSCGEISFPMCGGVPLEFHNLNVDPITNNNDEDVKEPAVEQCILLEPQLQVITTEPTVQPTLTVNVDNVICHTDIIDEESEDETQDAMVQLLHQQLKLSQTKLDHIQSKIDSLRHKLTLIRHQEQVVVINQQIQNYHTKMKPLNEIISRTQALIDLYGSQ